MASRVKYQTTVAAGILGCALAFGCAVLWPESVVIWSCAIIAIAALVFFVTNKRLPSQRRPLPPVEGDFERREALSDDEIFEHFFSADPFPRQRVLEIWDEVAGALDVDPGRMRPTDRFGYEIGTSLGIDDNLVDLWIAARTRSARAKLQIDPQTLATVREYVVFFASAQQGRDR